LRTNPSLPVARFQKLQIPYSFMCVMLSCSLTRDFPSAFVRRCDNVLVRTLLPTYLSNRSHDLCYFEKNTKNSVVCDFLCYYTHYTYTLYCLAVKRREPKNRRAFRILDIVAKHSRQSILKGDSISSFVVPWCQSSLIISKDRAFSTHPSWYVTSVVHHEQMP
jgi:hypothetical protein